MVKKIESWKTDDGLVFEDEIKAIAHENYWKGRGNGVWTAITELEDTCKMGAGGNLTQKEIEQTDYWKAAQFLRLHFKNLKWI